MKIYNRLFSLCYSVTTHNESDEALSYKDHLEAIQRRLKEIVDNEEWREALSYENDTYQLCNPQIERRDLVLLVKERLRDSGFKPKLREIAKKFDVYTLEGLLAGVAFMSEDLLCEVACELGLDCQLHSSNKLRPFVVKTDHMMNKEALMDYLSDHKKHFDAVPGDFTLTIDVEGEEFDFTWKIEEYWKFLTEDEKNNAISSYN